MNNLYYERCINYDGAGNIESVFCQFYRDAEMINQYDAHEIPGNGITENNVDDVIKEYWSNYAPGVKNEYKNK